MLETRAAAKKLIEMGEAVGGAVLQFQAYHALAILELGAGRYSEALLAAEFATDREAIGWRCQSFPWSSKPDSAVEIGWLPSARWRS